MEDDFRTPEGVDACVAERHREIATTRAVEPVAWLWVKRSPDGAEGTMRFVGQKGAVTLDPLVAAVRKAALDHQAYGVLFVVPLVEVEDLPLSGRIDPSHAQLKLAFMVEHMSEKIGKRFYTAPVVDDSSTDGPQVGPLEFHPEGFMGLGPLSELLPQRGMN